MRLLGAFLRLLLAGALGAPPAPVRTGGVERGGRSGAAGRGWRAAVPPCRPYNARLSLPAGPGGAGDSQRGGAR